MDKLKSYLSQGVSFIQDSWNELSKVHYPSPKETMQATIVVVGLTFVMALWLGVIDFFAVRAVQTLLR